MEQNNNEKITIEDLARMVKNGFDETARKSDIEGLKSDVKVIKSDVEGLRKEVKDIGHKVNQIDKRLFTLEEDIYETKRKQQEKLEGRVTFIERKLGIGSAR
jgi:archaellum component FlaC